MRGAPRGIDVSYRVSGGAPGEQVLDEELRVSFAILHLRFAIQDAFSASAGIQHERTRPADAPLHQATPLDI